MFTVPPALSFTLLLLTWWITNNVYAIDAELLFKRFTHPHLYVDLTLIQILLGLLFANVYNATTNQLHPPNDTSESRDTPKDIDSRHDFRYRTLLPLVIGAVHNFATLLTNISYATIGSTTTLMWKLSEPLSAIILKHLVLSETTSTTSITAVIITLSGVLLFSKSTFTIPTFTPIILSNLLFPTRNVCLKLSQRHTETSLSQMYTMALPPALLLFLPKLFLQGSSPEALLYMLRNAMLFNIYQFASLALLHRLDALTHSLLNTLKRFSAILLSMLVISTPLHANHYQGLLITLFGFCLYLLGGRNVSHKFGSYTIPLALLIALGAIVALITSIGDFVHVHLPRGTLSFNTPSFNSTVLDTSVLRERDTRPRFNATAEMEFSRRRKKAAKKYMIMLSNAYRHGPAVGYKSYEEAFNHQRSNMDNIITSYGGNVGNLVWRYGAHVSLPDFSDVPVCDLKKGLNCPKIAKKEGKALLHYLPMANMINPKINKTFTYVSSAMERRGTEVLIVGLGIQAEFRGEVDFPEFNSSARVSFTSDKFEIPKMTRRFVGLMREGGQTMLLRGDFTLRVVQRTGYMGGYSVGCPSFFINHEIYLGEVLEKQYEEIGKRVGDKSLKIGVNIKQLEGFPKQLVYIRDNYPNSRFYAQGPGDLRMLRKYKVPFEKTRFFTNVEDWIADIKEMDIGYGVRIHGNMVALAAGLPVVVVATDWRVLELAQVMGLPVLTSFDKRFEEGVDVADVVKAFGRFNGKAFDRNRCEKAKVFKGALGRYGIGVREHVQRISQIC